MAAAMARLTKSIFTGDSPIKWAFEQRSQLRLQGHSSLRLQPSPSLLTRRVRYFRAYPFGVRMCPRLLAAVHCNGSEPFASPWQVPARQDRDILLQQGKESNAFRFSTIAIT